MRDVLQASWLVLALVGCSGGGSQPANDAGTPPTGTDAGMTVGADAATDVPPNTVCTTLADGGVSAPAVDAGAGGMDAATLAPGGYLRFLNLSRGAGTVRFTATSAPGFPYASVTAVVREGEASPYVFTIPVPFVVNAFADPNDTPSTASDGGMDDGALFDVPLVPMVDAATPAGTLAPQLVGDVYLYSGCTVVLAGAADGSAGDQTTVQLWKITDVPMRAPLQGVGLVRAVSAIVGPTAVSIAEGATTYFRDVSYVEPFGFRELCAGVHAFTVTDEDDGTVLGSALAAQVLDGHPHTLYVWGDIAQGASMSARVLLTDDLPPGR